VTAKPSVRDRAAEVLRTAASVPWPNGVSEPPIYAAHTIDGRVLSIAGTPEQIADALAAAGLLAGDVPAAAECTDPACRVREHYVLR